MSAGKFLELVKCCHPDNNQSTEDVRKSWVKAFPAIIRLDNRTLAEFAELER
jgi:hypothetical protein